jgi:hypothetical protein
MVPSHGYGQVIYEKSCTAQKPRGNERYLILSDYVLSQYRCHRTIPPIRIIIPQKYRYTGGNLLLAATAYYSVLIITAYGTTNVPPI